MATDVMAAGLQEQLAEFVRLEEQRLALEAQLDETKKALAALQPALVERFADLGMQNTTIGDRTIYVRTDVYCSKRADASTPQLCEALERIGLGYMVGQAVSMPSLKSRIVEMQEQGEAVPDELTALLNIGETHKLVSRKR